MTADSVTVTVTGRCTRTDWVARAGGGGTPGALEMAMTHLDAIATRNRNPVTFDLVVFVMMLNALLLLALIVTQ